MRDLAVFGFMLASISLAINSVFISYLLWGWAGLVAINYYLYGFMSGVPYVQVYALMTIFLIFLKKDSGLKKFEYNRTIVFMLIFAAHGLLSALFAYPGLERNWELFGNVIKTILFCLLMPMIVVSRFRMHAVVLIIAFSISFHGVLDGLKFIASGGSHNAQSIQKFGDNNHLALIFLMGLPFLYYLYQISARKVVRLGFLLVFLLIVLAVVATRSRGALVGLIAVALWFILKSQRKILGVLIVSLCAVMVIQLAPDKWSQRMETIQAADEDASFMGRVTAWKVSSAIAVAHPWVGGGFRAVQSHLIWDQFKNSPGMLGFIETPVLNRSGVAAHSIWFEVLGDQGIVGLLLFILLIINVFITRREIWTLVRKNGQTFWWAGSLADMVGASMLAYVVAGSLLSAAYFELPYICMILMETLKQQQKK
ncbi:putative O-glycosylation ligase, exosortase A system-associated [Simplicispira psychrophila]|uniref:putative O-glycosylation ligase, exosortase A system-associated n=1 Tax=Simplicispira psychrophila TaxID=80882 RepID=UPI0012EC3D62|nr:putative O-glycosylation ligase, exosortase A system-associated [Simplicispira psychrophila]